MVLSHLLAGSTSLSCPEGTDVDLITTIKKPNKLPIPRWKTMNELFKELREMTNFPTNMMYT